MSANTSSGSSSTHSSGPRAGEGARCTWRAPRGSGRRASSSWCARWRASAASPRPSRAAPSSRSRTPGASCGSCSSRGCVACPPPPAAARSPAPPRSPSPWCSRTPRPTRRRRSASSTGCTGWWRRCGAAPAAARRRRPALVRRRLGAVLGVPREPARHPAGTAARGGADGWQAPLSAAGHLGPARAAVAGRDRRACSPTATAARCPRPLCRRATAPPVATRC